MAASTRTVTSQAELDEAIADGVRQVEIRSAAGVRLTVCGSARVVASGSAHVEASGSARVVAWDTAHVAAWGSARVEAWGSAHVTAWGSAHVAASDTAHVAAWDTARVAAWDTARVTAWGATSVAAHDAAKINASAGVAVHLHSGHATVEGGVLIDHTNIDMSDPATWCEHNGVQVDDDGVAVVYKAVDDDWRSRRGTSYEPGTTATCDDFADTDECGGGLHFAPTPGHAADYNPGASRFVECHVPLSGLRPLLGGTAKCKAASAVCVREVDRWMEPFAAAAEVVSS